MPRCHQNTREAPKHFPASAWAIGQVIAAYKLTPPINKKTGHEICRPHEATSATQPVARKVAANTIDRFWKVNDRSASKIRIAAKPHHAIVVICQANRSVSSVNSEPPKILGKSSRRNRRMRMYRSPNTECNTPIMKVIWLQYRARLPLLSNV
jgi:hypothetical protein